MATNHFDPMSSNFCGGEELFPDASMNSVDPLNPANDPCASVVHVLQCYHQGGEDSEFVRKAIESLVKKLKDRRTELDALISAVTSGGKQTTPCVCIHVCIT